MWKWKYEEGEKKTVELTDPRDSGSPCQMMKIGVYNHLRNERYLVGPITILRR